MEQTSQLYGLMAEFTTADELLTATERTTAEGFECIEAFSPFPVEGLAEAMKFRTWLPLIVLIGGAIGAAAGYYMQYWMAAIDYPINVGGRPLHSWPSFIPVTFEMTVLVAGLTAAVFMLALNGLPKPYHPVFNVSQFDQVTNNRFFLVIETDDPKFHEIRTREFIQTLHPKEIHNVER